MDNSSRASSDSRRNSLLLRQFKLFDEQLQDFFECFFLRRRKLNMVVCSLGKCHRKAGIDCVDRLEVDVPYRPKRRQYSPLSRRDSSGCMRYCQPIYTRTFLSAEGLGDSRSDSREYGIYMQPATALPVPVFPFSSLWPSAQDGFGPVPAPSNATRPQGKGRLSAPLGPGVRVKRKSGARIESAGGYGRGQPIKTGLCSFNTRSATKRRSRSGLLLL
jgi:hypothetical protein